MELVRKQPHNIILAVICSMVNFFFLMGIAIVIDLSLVDFKSTKLNYVFIAKR